MDEKIASIKDKIESITGNIIEKESLPPPKKKWSDQSKDERSGFPEIKRNYKLETINETHSQKNKIEQEMNKEYDPNDKELSINAERYDLTGELMKSKDMTAETILGGLHHHNDDSDKPGYAFYELAMLSRSRNIAQRASAFQTIYNIIKDKPFSFLNDLKMIQIHILCTIAFNSPTSKTIKEFATRIIMLIVTHFENPLSIYPYPAVPQFSFLTVEFAPHTRDFAILGEEAPEIWNATAIMMIGAKEVNINFIERNKTCVELLRVARSAFINWNKRLCTNKAIDVLKDINSSVEILEEAAVLLRLQKVDIDEEIMDILDPKILCILISDRQNLEPYRKYFPSLSQLKPVNNYIAEMYVGMIQQKYLSTDVIPGLLEDMEFSQSYVILASTINAEIKLPPLPTTEEDCWLKRGEIIGHVQYLILKKDYSNLPHLFKCLFSYTNPSADILCQSLFGFDAPPSRPINPDELFKNIQTVNRDQLVNLMDVAKYFIVHFSCKFFDREDYMEHVDIYDDYISNVIENTKEKNIFDADLTGFTRVFEFGGYEVEAFQKFAILCLTQRAEAEVRSSVWGMMRRLASCITAEFTKADHFEPLEDDLDIVALIIDVLKYNSVENCVTNIALNIINKLLDNYKGTKRGLIILQNAKDIQEVWRDKLQY